MVLVFYLQHMHIISNTFLGLQYIVLQKCNGQVGIGRNLIILEKKDKTDLKGKAIQHVFGFSL